MTSSKVKADKIAVLIFSYNLEKVVLVRRKGEDQKWEFPCKAKAEGSLSELNQAGTVAQEIAGIGVGRAMSGEYIEFIDEEGEGDGEEQKVICTHAYVAVDIIEKESESKNDQIEEVKWHPFQSLLYSSDDSPELPYSQYIDKLLFFVDRHPELRIEPDLELKKCVTWHKDRWVGESPREFLRKWCESHQYAEACYNVIEQRRNINANVAFCGVCVLPHLGVQVVAERSFLTIDEAVENASLMALLYLDGAIPDGSTRFCHAIPVGYQIPLKRPFFEGNKVMSSTFGARNRRMLPARSGGMNARPNKRARTSNSNAGVQEDADKNAIMMVKEYCDKAKWEQPSYQYEQLDGEYIAIVTLTPANIEALKGPPGNTQKLAKNLVAEQVWKIIKNIPLPILQNGDTNGKVEEVKNTGTEQEGTENEVNAQGGDGQSGQEIQVESEVQV